MARPRSAAVVQGNPQSLQRTSRFKMDYSQALPAELVQIYDFHVQNVKEAREELATSDNKLFAPIQEFAIEHSSKRMAAITTILDNVKVWTYE